MRNIILMAMVLIFIVGCDQERRMTRAEWEKYDQPKDANEAAALGQLGHERTQDEIKKEDAKSYRDIERASIGLIVIGVAAIAAGLIIDALQRLIPIGGIIIVAGIGGVALVAALKAFPFWIALGGAVIIGLVLTALTGFGSYWIILRLRALRENIERIERIPESKKVKDALKAEPVSATTEKIINQIKSEIKGKKDETIA